MGLARWLFDYYKYASYEMNNNNEQLQLQNI